MDSMFTQSLNACEATDEAGAVTLIPDGETDFVRQYRKDPKDDAAYYYTETEGDFTLSAEVETLGANTYDAGFIMVRESADRWIKLAAELNADGKYNAVSVITHGFSDDANGELLPDGRAWLRITRKGNVWGLHYSLNGNEWRFVRTFPFEMPHKVMAGYGVQAPKGAGCKAIVKNIRLVPGAVDDFRNGS